LFFEENWRGRGPYRKTLIKNKKNKTVQKLQQGNRKVTEAEQREYCVVYFWNVLRCFSTEKLLGTRKEEWFYMKCADL
jgi:hypothetical protein